MTLDEREPERPEPEEPPVEQWTFPILYHYCSSEAFLAMMRTRTLWLSSFSFMNDSLELRHAVTMYRRILPKMIDELRSETTARLRSDAKEMVTHLALALGEYEEGGLLSVGAYGTCFSERRDQLSQWRAYGSDGSGFAIGFNMTNMSLPITKAMHKGTLPWLSLRKVSYEEPPAEALCRHVVHELFSAEYQTDDWTLLVYRAGEWLINRACDFKHPAFSEEEEWRLVLLPWIPPKQMPSITFDRETRYRAGRSGIIPYYQLRLPDTAFRSVWLGPKQANRMNETVVRRMLDDVGLANVKIHHSGATSYR